MSSAPEVMSKSKCKIQFGVTPRNSTIIRHNFSIQIAADCAGGVVAYPKEKFLLIGTKSFLDFVRPLSAGEGGGGQFNAVSNINSLTKLALTILSNTNLFIRGCLINITRLPLAASTSPTKPHREKICRVLFGEYF